MFGLAKTGINCGILLLSSIGSHGDREVVGSSCRTDEAAFILINALDINALDHSVWHRV